MIMLVHAVVEVACDIEIGNNWKKKGGDGYKGLVFWLQMNVPPWIKPIP